MSHNDTMCDLENAAERIGLFAAGGTVMPKTLREILADLHKPAAAAHVDLNTALDDLARSLIMQALERHRTQEKAALALGLKSGSALQGRMKTLGMQAPAAAESRGGQIRESQRRSRP